MQRHDSTVKSLLQPHSDVIQQVQVLCRSAGRYWIHRQSCDALASTYKQALQKLTNMLTQPLLSQQLDAQRLQLLMQPALGMLLAAVHQGQRFVETCRPSYSARHRWMASSSSSSLASSDGYDASVSSEHAITDDHKSWLHKALLKGCATDAIDVHLHDFLIAFSAVAAVIEDLNAQHQITQHSAHQVPSPDLFWREKNKPHVLLVSAQQLGHVKHHDDTVLNSQLEMAMNLRGYPDDVGTTQQQITTITMAADDAAQLAAFVKDKIRCAKQAFHEIMDPAIFLDFKELEVVRSISASSVHISVLEVMWLGRKFALKWYKKGMGEAFLQEAKIHFRLHHPNVVHAVALCKEQKEYGILMELMDESLQSFLQRQRFSLGLQEKVSIMLQIAKGMAYVHERGVIHRDLKPSNLLVRSSMDTQASTIQQLEVKVADFGESNMTRLPDSSSFTTKRIGTSVYRAPEVLNDKNDSFNFTLSYKRSADVYSFAMTCFELLVEKEAFHDSERRQALWDRVVGGERPDLASISDSACPPYLKHCLETWWADDPRTRHSFTHICCILRHMYACLARCQRDTQPIVEFPFLAWPFWRWRHAQDIAQQRLHELERRRADDDWKDKGNRCESTRVHEIPYEMHVMQWAIKKAADEPEEAIEPASKSQSSIVSTRVPVTADPPANKNRFSTSASQENFIVSTRTPATAPSANGIISRNITAPARKNFRQKLQEFCCFSASVTPSTHEAFHDETRRRN